MNDERPVTSDPVARAALLGSFRVRLSLWVGGLALFTLLVVGLYGAELAMKMRRDYAGQQLLASARHIGVLLASQLQEREKEIQILSRAPTLVERELDSAPVKRALDLRKQANEEYAWLGIVTAEGRVVSSTGGLLQGVDVTARPWFQAALGGPFTGDVHEAVLLAKLLPAAAGGEPMRFIDIATPIRDESGNVRGVLGAHIHWSWVSSIVERALVDDHSLRDVDALIVARDGSVLYPASKVGQKVRGSAADGYGVASVDQEDVLVGRAELPPTRQSSLGWSIVLEKPLRHALQPVVDLRNQLVLLGIVLAVCLAGAAYALAARASRPLERLVRAIRDVEAGHGRIDEFPQQCGSTEVTALARSVRSMTETVLEREDRLEQTVARRTEELLQANRELSRLAMQDPLTGVANRRAFDERCGFEETRSRRSGKPFGLLIIDVDRFKSVNDTYGHAVGDRVLQQLGEILRLRARETDLVARFGGEEFAVLLPEISGEDDAMLVGEQIRVAVEAWPFEGVGRLTVSVGCTVVDIAKASIPTALRHADAALYRAKESGRNRCLSAMPT